MTTDIIIPTLGESIAEGVVAAWLVDDGQYVERDAPLMELETDKITMEVPAPASGIVHTAAKVGDTVTVGATVGAIEESAEKPAPKAPAATTDAAPAPMPQPAQATVPEPTSAAGGAEVHATPLAKKLAGDLGVDLSNLTGTGPGGRIREQDVLALTKTNGAPKPTSAPPPSPSGRGPGRRDSHESTGDRETTRERMSPLRQKIASRLVEAQHTAAMLTTFNECDMTNVMALRSRHKDDFLRKHGVKLGFMSFFVKAAVSALREFPLVNSYIVEGEQGPEIEKHGYCDIAVAVGTDKGLVVPVLRNCDSRSFAQVEQGILDLADKARSGKLALEDMQGGTFTISNGGVYGSMLSTPILNPPQSGILGMHNIMRRPVERPDKPGSGEVEVRPMMYLALSYDHRIVDGAGAVGFLKHIKECIESPERLLLEV
ncbi:MAG: 2-oxoglutarate dehydrogenase complex dihydrolipoyllysine-residue succinyltransferase [Phycisphaeraceae bacterium]|nr:2-oxoglutarate dehydrogenase complex dihydrolipoyllysine-residue succinyltransferase [Phycisphaeraceae bacterium]MCB9847347.1 2-oxoglutarate dehydrogenase complex dihydrolipoyllysine-residue succinyltransferase [Phycisphaeraceae bacterium]